MSLMKKLNLNLSSFLVFFFLNCSFSYSEDVKNIYGKPIVIDGDTINLNNQVIRFSGIDAPEYDQICINGEQKIYCGMFSIMLLTKKIGNETPKCISEGKDAYKRTLAECFINGESLSAFLVRSGYAFAYRKYSKKFIKDEEFAKENKLGIWSLEFEYPWDFRKKK